MHKSTVAHQAALTKAYFRYRRSGHHPVNAMKMAIYSLGV